MSSGPPLFILSHPPRGKRREMMSGVITVSGPVTEYKRLSDVLKISENMTRLPETGERWADGREPSYLPPAPWWLGSSRKLPSPAQGPGSLAFLMHGPKMRSRLKVRFRPLSIDGVPSPGPRGLTVQWGVSPQAWALTALGLQDRRTAPALATARSLPTASPSPRCVLHLPRSPAIGRAVQSRQAVRLYCPGLRGRGLQTCPLLANPPPAGALSAPLLRSPALGCVA